jgi:hypothetical protein
MFYVRCSIIRAGGLSCSLDVPEVNDSILILKKDLKFFSCIFSIFSFKNPGSGSSIEMLAPDSDQDSLNLDPHH